ncbi:MAG: cation:proton antiporter [Parcubacteria group bacterium]|nr:cation:proton antiporter [Parcubacteria group bacterium]
MLEELFFEIGIILVIAAALSMLMYRFKQPLIIAYIITGVIVGPSLLALTGNPEILDLMAQIGVAFLLFTVGLGLNWRNVKDVGGIALAAGVGQVLFTSAIGFLIAILLGFDVITSAYISVAFAFSSTIVIVKLLMDKEDLDSLYGRISIGFLLVQDFIAMLILLGISGFSSGVSIERLIASTSLKAIVLIPLFWFISVKLLPRILAYVARSQELLFIFSVAWCFLIAGALVMLGFGVELGALIAGVTLSSSVYYQEINSRIRPLRDFFLIIFFIMLGTQLSLVSVTTSLVPTIVFSLFVLIGNPVIVMFLMRLLGYHQRTGFLFGTAVAQISEFSFILLVAGVAAGHLSTDVVGMATAVGLVTIAGSSFMIQHNEKIFQRFKPMFVWMEPKTILESELLQEHKATEILLMGYHRTGAELLPALKQLKRPYVVVDFDPVTIRGLAEIEEPSVYGDVGDQAFLEEIKADHSRLIISTIPDFVISTALLSFLRSRDFKGVVVVSVHSDEEARQCYELGATYVIVPPVLSGKKFSEILVSAKIGKKNWNTLRKQSIMV